MASIGMRGDNHMTIVKEEKEGGKLGHVKLA